MSAQQLITEHIDLWTSTIKAKNTQGRGSSKKRELYGIKKLRELIIELAVRGKLVPQDSNDEPASVLLVRIAADKAQLVRDKKIKKQKSLPKIADKEKPFELPNGWEWVRLGEATNYGSSDKIESKDANSSTWILELEDVEKETSKLLQKIRFCDREFKSSKNKFYKGDVIYGKLRPYLDKVLVADENGVCTTEMIPIRAHSAINAHHLRLIMKSPYFKEYANNSTHGMSLPRMGTDKARLALIPVVPELEQHRIVAKVDELMALCNQLEQKTGSSLDAHNLLADALLETLTDARDANELSHSWARMADHFDTLITTDYAVEQLKQTILRLAVQGKLAPQNSDEEPATELLKRIGAKKSQLIKDKIIRKQKPLQEIRNEDMPSQLPDGWAFERLGNFTIVGTGATPSRSNPSYWEPGDVNWASSGETSAPFLEETKEKVSELAVKETNVSVYPIGTLIVAMYGQGKTRGQVTELRVEAGTNQACAAIRLIDSSDYHKGYVKLFFQKSYFELREQAAGGAQPNLNVGKISELVLLLPPLEEQQRIVAKVDELMALCGQLKAKLNNAQTTQLQLADTVVDAALN